MATRELFVKTMLLPILDYGDVVLGDKHNQTLMQKIQVTHNTAAKVVLDRPKQSSANEALTDLNWKTMTERRRIHRLIFTCKGMKVFWIGILISYRLLRHICLHIILYYIILYYIILYYIILYYIILYRIVSHRIASHRIASHRIVSYRIILYYIILYYIILYYIILYYIILYYIILYYMILYYIILYYIILYYIISCYAMSCHIVSAGVDWALDCNTIKR